MVTPVDIARAWLNAVNDHDLNRIGTLCSEDAISDEVADPPLREGRDQIVESYRELFEGFPDSEIEILNIFGDQNQALSEVLWSGTNKGRFRGDPPTNKYVEIRIAYVFKVEGGKIKKITEYYDGASVASQMES